MRHRHHSTRRRHHPSMAAAYTSPARCTGAVQTRRMRAHVCTHTRLVPTTHTHTSRSSCWCGDGNDGHTTCDASAWPLPSSLLCALGCGDGAGAHARMRIPLSRHLLACTRTATDTALLRISLYHHSSAYNDFMKEELGKLKSDPRPHKVSSALVYANANANDHRH